MTMRQLRHLISEELKGTTDEILSHDRPEDVIAHEDVWAGGHNIHWLRDHSLEWADQKTPDEGYAAEDSILSLTKHLREMHDHPEDVTREDLGHSGLMLSREEACKAVIAIAGSTSCPVTRQALVEVCMELLSGGEFESSDMDMEAEAESPADWSLGQAGVKRSGGGCG